MDNLYTDLATVYEAMYQSFINYQEEYAFYSELLNKYDKKSVLEVGSGTGNLAAYFVQNGYEYSGLDYSKEMIALAKAKNLGCEFSEGDMRDFDLGQKVSSIIMTGRTISYLQYNHEVNSMLQCVNKQLEKGGVFSFDFIDANKFIPDIGQEKAVTHEAAYAGVDYVRKSIWKLKLEHGMDLFWTSTYYKKNKDELVAIGTDSADVRTFTKDEMIIFLTLNGFEVKELIERPSYFFPTYVILAEKI